MCAGYSAIAHDLNLYFRDIHSNKKVWVIWVVLTQKWISSDWETRRYSGQIRSVSQTTGALTVTVISFAGVIGQEELVYAWAGNQKVGERSGRQGGQQRVPQLRGTTWYMIQTLNDSSRKCDSLYQPLNRRRRTVDTSGSKIYCLNKKWGEN